MINTYQYPLTKEEVTILFRLSYINMRYKTYAKLAAEHPEWGVSEEQLHYYQVMMRKTCSLYQQYMAALTEKYSLPLVFVSRTVDFQEEAIIYTL